MSDAAGVAIVGAGAAGMMAALAAARGGAGVLLAEKSVAGACNAELGGGLVQGAGTRFQRALGIDDGPERMFADIMAVNGGDADAAVVRAVCERSADVVHVLADVAGLELHLDTNVRYLGHSAYRMHAAPDETGAQVVAALRAAVAREPRIELVDEAHVAEVSSEGGAVTGLVLERPCPRRVPARAVVLACDDFGADPAMVREHCPEIAGAAYIGSPNNTGDGIRWGAGLGAALDRMTAYQGHAHVNPGLGTRLGGGLPSMGAMIVDAGGRRFEREDQGYSEFARVVLARPGGTAVEVFDQRIFDLAWANGAFRAAHAAGAVVRAADAAELARAFDLPAAALSAELEAFNRIAEGEPDRLGHGPLAEPLRAPLYGARITGALAHTQGGLRIDARCRVLDAGDRPIGGLYAAGGTAAGISGSAPEGYMSGNGLAQAFGTGLIAGEQAAAAARA